MGDFIIPTISQIGETITGRMPSSESPGDFGNATPFVTPSDSFDQKFITHTERSLSAAGVAKLRGKLLPPNSVLVTCIGSAMGKVAMCKVASVSNQQINSIVVRDDYSADYIYYTLTNNYRFLRNAATGSTALPLLNKGDFDAPKFQIHSNKAEQKKIAAVLSALDAKIDLNQRINAELEALAKTIYDYWFVQFDFPDAHGSAYKSSGGAMVWNDVLEREIPAGWRADTIRDVAELGGGGTPSKSNDDFWNGDIPFFSPADAVDAMFQFETTDHITPAGLDACSSAAYPTGTVFITARGSVGKVVIAGRSMAMNQSCYALRPKAEAFLPFLYFHTRTLVEHLKVKASGSTFNSIVTNDIDWTSLVKPPAAVIENFHTSVRPMFDRIAAGSLESAELTKLRDWLLPLLMNGQVRVD